MTKQQKIETLKLIKQGVPAKKALCFAEMGETVVFVLPRDQAKLDTLRAEIEKYGIEKNIINITRHIIVLEEGEAQLNN